MFYRRDPHAEATWQTLVVAPPAQVDRSPCGTGTSALIAHLLATGAVADGGTVTTRSIVGGEFTATATPATTPSARPGAVVPVISGSAYINGFHVVVADPADRFRNGFESL
jgi:proline racemase